jgi:5-methylcytosine-specific restriction endonuclease McrA
MPRSDGRDYLTSTEWKTTLRQQVLAKTGGRCWWCGSTGGTGRGRGLALCHLVPWPIGPNTVENLVPGCGPCHRIHDAAGHRRARRKESTPASPRLVAGRPAFAGSVNPFEDCPSPALGQQIGVGHG